MPFTWKAVVRCSYAKSITTPVVVSPRITVTTWQVVVYGPSLWIVGITFLEENREHSRHNVSIIDEINSISLINKLTNRQTNTLSPFPDHINARIV